MKKAMKMLLAMAMMIFAFGALGVTAAAAGPEEATEVTEAVDNTTSNKAYAAALCVGMAAVAGAIGMAVAISKSNESIARQPEAEGKIRTAMMLGLVFIETAIIYALIVAILIIFVL